MRTPAAPRFASRVLAAASLCGVLAVGCGDESTPPAHVKSTTAAARITAEREQWTWIPFDDAFCADGNPTGLAVNLTDRSKNALVFLMGGGACWDYPSCYQSPLAVYVASGFGETDMPFLTIMMAAVGLTARDDPANPFRDYSFVAIPYCTGDAFTGSHTATYEGRKTMHVGHANVMAYLRRIVPTFPDADRVAVVGVSAGGVGAAFNWWHIQQAFGDIRVDMIDDSGPALPAPYLTDQLAQTWRDSWGLNAGLPSGCTECETALDDLVTWSADHIPKSRGALLSFTQDNVLPDFMSISEQEFEMGLDALAKQRLDGLARFRYFFVDGSAHVLLPHAALEQNGVKLWDWIDQMESDDPSWQDVRP